MPLQSLTTFEHRRIPIRQQSDGSGITNFEADILLGLATRRPGFCERGFDHVKLAQYCGVASLGERTLEILPKTEDSSTDEQCRGMLVRLLSQAADAPIFRNLSVGQDAVRSSLLEVFVSALLDTVADVVRGGLLVQYDEKEEDLPVIRGAIQFNRQLTQNANRVDRVACRFDELTSDNVWNQVLRFGLWLVRPLIVSSLVNGRWIELAAALEDVSDHGFTLDSLKRLHFTRRAARYKPSIDWIRLLVQLRSPDLRSGQDDAPGLLFDMNKLFERSVANFVSRRADGSMTVGTQEPDRVLTTITGRPDQPIGMVRPDLVIRRAGKIVAVADTKWKCLSVGRSGFLIPSEDDVYQVLAYAAAYGCNNLALIYPWYSGLAGSAETRLSLPSVGTARPELSIICLDLKSPQFRAVRGADSSEWVSLLSAASAA